VHPDKRFVYVLRSDRNPRRHYVRLVRDRPWHLLVSLEFRTAEAAGQFERYLKTGSGRAFAKRHFP